MKKYINYMLKAGLAVVALVLLQLGASTSALAQQTGSDFDHSATGFVLTAQHLNVRCETCHVKGVFKGTPKTCEACHGWNNPIATMVMPVNHIPTSNAPCESCHASNMTQFQDALRVFTHISVAPMTCRNCHDSKHPHPGVTTNPNDQLHQNASTTSCDICHTNTQQFSGSSYPINHMPVGSNATCGNCHASGTFTNAQFTHSGISSGCANCHGSSVVPASFAGSPNIVLMPRSGAPGSIHIPSSETCESCHVAPGGLMNGTAAVVVGPGTRFQLPLPSSSQIHSASNVSSCNVCHEQGSNFIGVNLYPPTPSTYVANSIYHGFQTRPTVAGGGFSVADASHPAADDCGSCHTGFNGFATPLPKVGHIPVAANASCTACHKDRGGDYTVMPALSDIHANYLPGFTCVQCHSVSNAAKYATAHQQIVAPPGTHIPMGTLGCETCHVGAGSSMASTAVQDGDKFSGSLFSHSGISSGCDACHGASVMATTFYGVAPVALAGLVPAHMPTSGACETCHINNVPQVLTPAGGVTFANAKFSHTGISSGCANCHGPTIVPASFAGSPNIVVMPPSAAPGASSHIPSSTTCENCHLGSTPTGAPISGSAAMLTGPGTKFQSPAPLAGPIHTYSDVSSCNACHEAGNTYIGMDQYARTTTSPYVPGSNLVYHGFQTRPNGGGGLYSIQDANHPGATECSTCHVGYNGFGAPVPPAGHIPVSTTATCANCHGSDTVNFTNAVPLANIHQFAQSTTGNCVQCHSVDNSKLYPLKHATVSAPTPPSADHIPMGTSGCETCHVSLAGNSSISVLPVGNGAVFSGSKFSHAGVNVACSVCHGVNVTPTTYFGLPNIKVLTYGTGPTFHMPVSGNLTCDTCHTTSKPTVLTPAAGVTFAGAQFSHTGITTDCANCHGPTVTANTFLGGGDIVVMPPSAAPGASSHIPTTSACENCHLAAKPAALVNARAASLVGPGTGFQNFPPNSTTIHGNVTVGTCNACHGATMEWMGMSLYPSTPPRTAALVTGTVYTGFQTLPGGGGNFAVNDTGHTSTAICSNCHVGYNGFGPPTMGSTHIPVLASSSCANCHTDPSGDYSVPPAKSNIHKYAPSYTTNCAQCHSTANAALYPMTPAIVTPNTTAPIHMPLGGQACETCHVASLTGLSTNANPSFAGAVFTHTGASTGCVNCHTSGQTFQGTTTIVAIPSTFSAPGPTSHMPFSTSCETCHSGNTPTTLLPAVATNTAGNSGFSNPPVPGAAVHVGATTCNGCHETGGTGTVADVWMGLTTAQAAKTSSPYSGFQTRPSTTASAATTFRVVDAIHPTTDDCSKCHAGYTDFAGVALPQYHIPTAAVACAVCHVGNNYTSANKPTFTAIHANAPSGSTCSQCHSATNATNYNQLVGIGLPIVSPPGTHISMGNLSCEGCHISSGTVTSSITGAVVNGANFRNSAYSHSGVATGCASCHSDTTSPSNTAAQSIAASSGLPLNIVSTTANHVPNTGVVGCETCHTTVPPGLIAYTGSGASAAAINTFKTTQYSHKGITASCNLCHDGSHSYTGITNMVLLPSTAVGNHIPSSDAILASACEACHTKNIPTGISTVSGTAAPTAVGSTGFRSPAPTGLVIHNGVTTGCNTCHENPYTWLGVGLYPRTANSATKGAGASYVGFQTRPAPQASAGTYSQVDATHPGVSAGDCSKCHGSTTSFTVSALPSNHIPISSSATCDACHTTINIVNGNADFSAKPSITNIHKWAPSQTVNCAQCHSDANALKYNNSTSTPATVIYSPSSPLGVPNTGAAHVPFGTTACEVCHIVSGAIVDGATFGSAKYSHTGVSTGCDACHSAGKAFFRVGNLVTIGTTSTTNASTTHIPTASTACEICHAGSTPTTPSTVSPTGPPLTPPATGFRLPAPTGVMIHTGITQNCNVCHDTGYVWLGVSLYPINPTAVTAGANYNGFQTRPITGGSPPYGISDSGHPTSGDCSVCHPGTTVFTAVAMPAGHMPATVTTCVTCHAAGNYSVTGLASLTNIHTGITAGMVTYTATTIGKKVCVTCHVAGTGGTSGTAPFVGCTSPTDTTNCPVGAPPKLSVYQPMVKEAKGAHVPIGTLDCNGCHANVTSFASTNLKNQTMHDNVKLGGVLCKDCHEYSATQPWFGITNLVMRTPSKHTTAARKAPNNCANTGCHDKVTVSGGFRMLQQPVMRAAQVSPDMARIRPTAPSGTPMVRGTLGNTYDHKNVQVGQCKSCHDGKAASGMPARHLMVSTSCDTCHRATSWTPAQFSHNGVSTNTCLACHNGISASTKPPGHFMTARSCDSCHKSVGWTPVMYQHLSPQYQPSPSVLTCIGCHVTNGEIIPRQMRGLNRTKPIPVGP